MIKKRTLLTAAIMIISIPILWKGLIAARHYPNFIVPPPEMVFDVLKSDHAVFWFNTKSTISIALKGYAISNVLAIGLSLLFVYIKGFEQVTKPWAMIITMVPFPVIAGIFAVTFRQPETPKIIIIILITFYPLLINLTKGLKSVEQVHLDRMEVLNASRWQIFWKVRWPAAMPYYIASHEIAFPGSIIGAIVAEWFFSREGLGFLIIRAQMQYRTDKLFAVALIGLALELIAYCIVQVAEYFTLAWRRS
jgi:NitT/TauT family transport system permease protein